MHLEKTYKPPYLTESTEVVLCGVKHNAELVLLLRAHAELHLALGDSILWPQSSSKTSPGQEIAAAILADRAKSQRTVTILKITEERKRCSFGCSLTLPQAAIRRALLTLRSSRHATANTAASRKAHLQETRLQSSSYGSSLACPTQPLLASTSRLGSGEISLLTRQYATRNRQLTPKTSQGLWNAKPGCQVNFWSVDRMKWMVSQL